MRFSFLCTFLILSPSSFCGHQKLSGEVHSPADRSLPNPVAYSSTYSLDRVPPARTPFKEHLYRQKLTSVSCRLCPLNVKTSEKDAVVTGAQEAVCYLPLGGHLEAPRSSALEEPAVVQSSVFQCPISLFLVFNLLFNQLPSLTLWETLFEPRFLTSTSPCPALLIVLCSQPLQDRNLLPWPQRLPQTGPGNSAAKIKQHRDIPGGPVANSACSQCKGPRFDPWSGN